MRFLRPIPQPVSGAIIMASSAITFASYARPVSSEGHLRLQAQMRTWLPVLAFAMIFAVESTSYFGADRTSAPLQRVVEAIFGYDVCVHWNFIHHLIRKTGHFMGYGIFSLICFRGFWITFQCVAFRLLRQLRAYGMAILATFLVASADEFHQSFLPNRSGQFSDVLLDCCGAAALCLMLFLTMQVVEGRKQARARAICRMKPAYAGAAV
jgi:VanZ family protein